MGYFFQEVLLLWTGDINKNIGFFPTGVFIPNTLLLGTGEYIVVTVGAFILNRQKEAYHKLRMCVFLFKLKYGY